MITGVYLSEKASTAIPVEEKDIQSLGVYTSTCSQDYEDTSILIDYKIFINDQASLMGLAPNIVLNEKRVKDIRSAGVIYGPVFITNEQGILLEEEAEDICKALNKKLLKNIHRG